MTGNPLETIQAISHFVKPVFRKWEGLRLPYNIILLLILLAAHGLNFRPDSAVVFQLLIWLGAAVCANICFLAAPLTEAYLVWLGWRSPVVTVILFLVGVLISIPCVMFFSSPIGGGFM